MKDIIAKQDINFLDKPLWFQDMRRDGLGFVRTDIEGYEYRTGHKPPDKVDIIILLYLLMKSQKQNYADTIETTRRKIWNILYANNNAKENYLSYLSLSLKHNWGLRFKEEMELLRQAEQERLIEDAEKQRKAKKAAEQREAEQRKRAKESAEYEERKAAETEQLTEFYDSLSDEEKEDVEIKTEQALNGFERNRLAKHRMKGGKLPVLLALSVGNARIKVLKEIMKRKNELSVT